MIYWYIKIASGMLKRRRLGIILLSIKKKVFNPKAWLKVALEWEYAE